MSSRELVRRLRSWIVSPASKGTVDSDRGRARAVRVADQEDCRRRAAHFVLASRRTERGEIEVAAEFAIDSREEVLVERRGDAGRIVVGEFEHRRVFLEVVTDEDPSPAVTSVAASRRSSSRACAGSKLPMLEPRKSASTRARVSDALSRRSGSSRRRTRRCAASFGAASATLTIRLARPAEMSMGWNVRLSLPVQDGVDDQARLGRAAAAEFDRVPVVRRASPAISGAYVASRSRSIPSEVIFGQAG